MRRKRALDRTQADDVRGRYLEGPRVRLADLAADYGVSVGVIFSAVNRIGAYAAQPGSEEQAELTQRADGVHSVIRRWVL